MGTGRQPQITRVPGCLACDLALWCCVTVPSDASTLGVKIVKENQTFVDSKD